MSDVSKINGYNIKDEVAREGRSEVILVGNEGIDVNSARGFLAPHLKLYTSVDYEDTNSPLVEYESGQLMCFQDLQVIFVADKNKIVYRNSLLDEWSVINLEDSGWISVSDKVLYSLYFTDYGTSDNHKLWFRKIGNMVDIQGVVTPTQDVYGGQSYTETSVIFNLPDGYFPKVDTHFLCQGSGSGTWLCTVGKDGTVCMTRYRYNEESSYATVNAGNYMPIHVTFFTAD